jgi:hypothetical protein
MGAAVVVVVVGAGVELVAAHVKTIGGRSDKNITNGNIILNTTVFGFPFFSIL